MIQIEAVQYVHVARFFVMPGQAAILPAVAW